VDPTWPADGRALNATAGVDELDAIVSDGAGGAVVTWHSHSGGVYAQRVLASGDLDPAWPANGRLLGLTGRGYYSAAIADDAGGALVTWADTRSGDVNGDIYAHHVLGTGLLDSAWPAAGIAVCTAGGDQHDPAITLDGAGGAIVAWPDPRPGDSGIYAQRVTRDGRTPVLAAVLQTRADPGQVEIEWYAPSLASAATVYRRMEGRDWRALGVMTARGDGVLAYTDRDVEAGSRYGYRLGVWVDGSEHLVGEAWIRVPGRLAMSLEGLQPNPCRDDVVVSFCLPSPEPAVLEIFDSAGRRVVSRRLAAGRPGNQLLNLGALAVPSGTYFVRLAQAGRVTTRKACILR
jgi:hypothetical protein